MCTLRVYIFQKAKRRRWYRVLDLLRSCWDRVPFSHDAVPPASLAQLSNARVILLVQERGSRRTSCSLCETSAGREEDARRDLFANRSLVVNEFDTEELSSFFLLLLLFCSYARQRAIGPSLRRQKNDFSRGFAERVGHEGAARRFEIMCTRFGLSEKRAPRTA